ncbi:MAG: MBL fold metallo-hydrolase [Calditrichia bacterium]
MLFSMQIPALDALMLDVGQGDATLLRTAQRQTLLIDAGPATDEWSSADFAIIPALQHFGESRLRGLFITHPHLDHYGGAFRLLRFCDHRHCVFATVADRNRNGFAAATLSRKTDSGSHAAQRDDVLEIDAETKIFVLAPDAALSGTYSQRQRCQQRLAGAARQTSRSHNAVNRRCGSRSRVAVRKWRKLLRCDVLKVGHHGSKTSSTPGLLSLVKPEFATSSAGKFNRFRHPDSVIIRRLNAIHSNVFPHRFTASHLAAPSRRGMGTGSLEIIKPTILIAQIYSRYSPAMKALAFHSYGSPEVLAIEDVPDPKPAERQILVRVRRRG